MRKDPWERLDHRDLRVLRAHKVPRELRVPMEKMVNQVHQELGVPPVLAEMTAHLVPRDPRESLVLAVSLVQMVIQAIRVKQELPALKGQLANPDNRGHAETEGSLGREERLAIRESRDHKDHRAAKGLVVTLVQREKKACRAHRAKKEIRDGLVSLVLLELQVPLATRVTKVLLVPVDSQGQKETEV